MPVKPLTELRKYLLDNLGLNFTESREKELYKKLEPAANAFNYDSTDAFINWVIKTELQPKQIEILASFLTIGETYFLREIKALDYLEHIYLPELINKRRGKNQNIRIWSAGCASGEEPYSIAILLKRVIPDLKNWNISILATDINAKFLEKARLGIYTNWSFRKLPESFKKEHFKEIEKGKFQIKPEIKSMVTFTFQNLATDTYPSLVNKTNAIDIILNRNVLIYFSNDGIKQVTDRFYNTLTKGGVLLVSPVEMSSLISSKFSKTPYLGLTIYTKGSSKVEFKKLHEWNVPDTVFYSKVSQQFTKQEISKPIILPSKPILKKPTEKKTQIEKQSKEEVSDYEIAQDLYKSGKFEEAENILKISLSNSIPISKAIISLLIKTKANLGKLDKALVLCKKALETNKLDANLYYMMANIQQELGNNAEAILLLKRVIYIEPNFPLAHFSLGNLCLKSGKQNGCLKHYNNALNIISKLDPEEVLEESDGLTARRLTEIIKTIKE